MNPQSMPNFILGRIVLPKTIPQASKPEQSIALNYHEYQCLEMALCYLLNEVHREDRHPFFTQLQAYQVKNLGHWLNGQHLLKQLDLQGKNRADWSLPSETDVKLFILALKLGLSEDLIVTMAVDKAEYERDMAQFYAETENDYSLADLAFYDSYRAKYDYYCQIATHKTVVLEKLRALLAVMH